MAYEAKRIAIVDYNEHILTLYADFLALRGFRNLSTYSSGKEFLDSYKANDCAPDIVFVDMVMHDMNGFQVLEEALQSRLSETLFVSHSGYLNQKDSPWLGYIGFDFNLPKSSEPDDLIKTIHLLSDEKDIFLSKRRNPYANLLAAIHDLSSMRLRSAV